MPTIDPKKEVQRLMENHKNTPHKFNMLLLGDSGTGKTYLYRTARKPVHIDSFDPGGTDGLTKWKDSGEIIVDDDYEHDEIEKPDAYALWRDTFKERINNGYFKQFATYGLDSSTGLGAAILRYVVQHRHDTSIKKNELPKDFHLIPAYNVHLHPQLVILQQCIWHILQLPCDVIVTGHLEQRMRTRNKGTFQEEQVPDGFQYMVTGRGKVNIPLLFSEVYHTNIERDEKGLVYQLITARTGDHIAKTRMGSNGKLNIHEESNIKKILHKLGLDARDKEPLSFE